MASQSAVRSPAYSQLAEALRPYRRDYEKWAGRFYTIRDKAGRLTTLRLRPMQRAIRRAELDALAKRGQARLYVLKGRQGGITTDQQARSLHTVLFREGAQCLTLAHTREDTDRIFGITARALEHYPDAILPAMGEKAAREVSFPGLDSIFYTGTAGAKRSGRGLTLARLHGSEFAFWDDPVTTLNAALPALERPGTTVVLETTASGYGSAAHDFWQKAERGESGWLPLFYPWWECDPDTYRLGFDGMDEAIAFADTLDAEEEQLRTRHGLTLEQLHWRRDRMRSMGRDSFLQEYAEDAASCWLSVGGLVYDAGQLKAMMARVPTPVRTERNGALAVYVTDAQLREAAERGRVVIGADTAEGLPNGGDRSTFVARTLEGQLLVTFGESAIDPITFAALLNQWGRALGARVPAYLVVEKNAHGITVLRTLRDTHSYRSDRIYHRATQDTASKEPAARIGWVTSAETKPLLVDAFRELTNACLRPGSAVTVPAREVVRDAFGARREDNGTVKLNGLDFLVAECLAWIGRSSFVTVPTIAPVRW